MPLHLTIQGLDDFKADVSNAAKNEMPKQIRWAMVQSVNAVKNSAQKYVPYKTGTLRRSIFTDVSDSGFKGVIGQDSSIAPYGMYMEYGTGPHTIEPLNKRALFWPGAQNPVKRVIHPGTAAKPFMTPALENNLDTIASYFSEAIKNVVLKMAGRA